MPDPLTMAMIAATVIGTIAFAAFAGLRGWRNWLDFKRLELASSGHGHDLPLGPTGNRIELADLRERVRKLEAIAEGIEL